AILQPGTGLQALGVGTSIAVPGEEAKEAKDSEIVFPYPSLGITDEAKASCFYIRDPAHEVDHRTIGLRIKRVDGEVTPLCVGLPVSAERYLGPASVCLDVGAQRCHLIGLAACHDGDGTVRDAGGNRLEEIGRAHV